MTYRKKIFWVTTLIIVAAVAIVLCVTYFTGEKSSDFDGTLVQSVMDIPNLLT